MTTASAAHNVQFGRGHTAELPHPITAPNGGYASAVALTTGLIWRRSPETRLLARMRRVARGVGTDLCQPRTDWGAAMITPTTVAVVLGGVAVLPGGRGVSGPASVILAPSA